MIKWLATDLRNADDPSLAETGVTLDKIAVSQAVNDGAVEAVTIAAGYWLEVNNGVYRLGLPAVLPKILEDQTVVVVVTADGCLPAKHSYIVPGLMR